MRRFKKYFEESIECTCPRCGEDFWEDCNIELEVGGSDFDNNLLILLDKSHRFTKEEEEFIIKLADKFRYE